jgi:hypothetical protein
MAAVLLLGVPAAAAAADPMQPQASSYIRSRLAQASRPSAGAVKVSFSVDGYGTMTKLGAKSIKIYQSYDSNTWSLVKTYSSDSTAGLLGSNKSAHSGSVTYSGYVGVYYKAYVQFYAQNSSGSESLYSWTNVVV